MLLPNWNAKWHGQLTLCRFLNSLGITVLRMSMPYHDRRAISGHERADHLVGPNIGLTLHATRQAIVDTRTCLLWLAQQGYHKLGLVGTSIGSAVGSITMCHDKLVSAAAFLHVSTYFGEVVRTGMTTAHVWEGLRAKVTAEELGIFLVAGKSDAVSSQNDQFRPAISCHRWALRSFHVAGIYFGNVCQASRIKSAARNCDAPLRTLFTGAFPVQLLRRVSNGKLSVPKSRIGRYCFIVSCCQPGPGDLSAFTVSPVAGLRQ